MARRRDTVGGRLVLLAALISTKFTDTNGQITSGPSNIAAEVGTVTYFNCTANNIGSSNILVWERLTSDSYTTLFISTETTTKDPTNYGIEINAARGQYDLVVRSVTLSQGTKYWCDIVGSNNKFYGELVAVDAISCPSEGQLVAEGDTIIAMCSVNYSGYTNPKLVWTDSSGVSMASNGGYNSTRVESYLNFTARATDDTQTLTCTLTFSNSVKMLESTAASNIPTYTTSCTTYYYVTHGVSDVQFEPATDADGVISTSLKVGEQINCTSNGRPQPNYSWRAVDGNGAVETGEWLVLTDSMADLQQPVTYTCTASNTVNGKSYAFERNVTFTVVSSSSPVVKSSSVEPWVIAVAVVVPIVVITVAVIIGYCCYKQRKSNDEKGSKASTPFIVPVSNAPPTTSSSAAAAPYSAGPSPYAPAPGRSFSPNGAANQSGYGDLAGPSLGGSVTRIHARPAARGTSGNTSMLDTSRDSSTTSGTSSVGRGPPTVSMLPDPRAVPRAASTGRGSGQLPPPPPRPPSVVSSTGSRTSTGSVTSSMTHSTNQAPMPGGPPADVDGMAPLARSIGGSRPVSTAGSGIGRPLQSPPVTMAYRPSPDRSRSPSVHGSLHGSIV